MLIKDCKLCLIWSTGWLRFLGVERGPSEPSANRFLLYRNGKPTEWAWFAVSRFLLYWTEHWQSVRLRYRPHLPFWAWTCNLSYCVQNLKHYDITVFIVFRFSIRWCISICNSFVCFTEKQLPFRSINGNIYNSQQLSLCFSAQGLLHQWKLLHLACERKEQGAPFSATPMFRWPDNDALAPVKSYILQYIRGDSETTASKMVPLTLSDIQHLFQF